MISLVLFCFDCAGKCFFAGNVEHLVIYRLRVRLFYDVAHTCQREERSASPLTQQHEQNRNSNNHRGIYSPNYLCLLRPRGMPRKRGQFRQQINNKTRAAPRGADDGHNCINRTQLRIQTSSLSTVVQPTEEETTQETRRDQTG